MSEATVFANLARYLTEFRERKSLTRAELVKKSGVSATSLGRLENNDAGGITYRHLELISKMEFSTVSEFLSYLESNRKGAERVTDLSAKQRNILSLFESSDQDVVDHFLKLANEESENPFILKKFDWLLRLSTTLLKGGEDDLINREIDLLTNFIERDEQVDVTEKVRLVELLKHKYRM